MGTGLAIAALVVSAVSAAVAYRSWRAADRSATAAEAADRREREPRLSIVLDAPTPAPGDRVIYRLRSDGPQDLDALVIHRPRPPDRIVYNLAVTGAAEGWVEDEINLGPLSVTAEARFTLSCGAAPDLPEFRVRIECEAANDRWVLSYRLPAPRGEPLSQEVITSRSEVLAAALDEIDWDIRTAQSDNWFVWSWRARTDRLVESIMQPGC